MNELCFFRYLMRRDVLRKRKGLMRSHLKYSRQIEVSVFVRIRLENTQSNLTGPLFITVDSNRGTCNYNLNAIYIFLFKLW